MTESEIFVRKIASLAMAWIFHHFNFYFYLSWTFSLRLVFTCFCSFYFFFDFSVVRVLWQPRYWSIHAFSHSAATCSVHFTEFSDIKQQNTIYSTINIVILEHNKFKMCEDRQNMEYFLIGVGFHCGLHSSFESCRLNAICDM